MNGLVNAENTNNFTCYAPLGKSVVDYLLSSKDMYNLLVDFRIGNKLVESDHTPLIFEINVNRETPLNSCNDKANDRPNLDKRYRFIFDKDKLL